MALISFHRRDLYLWSGIGVLAAILILAQISNAVRTSSRPAHARVSVDFTQGAMDAVALLPPGSEASSAKMLSVRMVSNLLVDAIIQVESAGHPERVGSKGERGLMQIMETTWEEMAPKTFGEWVSFEQAFDPVANRRVGKVYLAELQNIIHRLAPGSGLDERELLLAAYNAGPTELIDSEFDLRRLSRSTLDYVDRICALHDLYVEQYRSLLTRTALGEGGPDTGS